MIEIYFTVVILIIILWFLKTKRDPRLPPGVLGWPIIGQLPSFKKPIIDQVQDYWKKYGDIFLWRIGSRNIVYLCNEKLIKGAFNNPFLIDRPDPLFTFDSWSYNKKLGLINGNGLAWQTTRRFALRNLRDSGFGRATVEDIILHEAECLIQNLKNYVDKKTEAPWSINVAVLNVIWRLVADRRFDCGDEEMMELESMISEVFVLAQGKMSLLDVFPWIIPFLPNFIMENIGVNRIQLIRKNLKTYLKKVIDEHREAFDPEHPRGIIDNYFLEMEKSKYDDSNIFNEEGLIISIGDMFFAGSDTSAATLRWTLLYLAKYQDIQEKIHAEISLVVPRDRLPNMGDKERLPYTDAAVHDLQRVVSLTKFGFYHAASKDTEIDGFFIPKGTLILPFLYGCHRDKRNWATPEEWNPDHFLKSDGSFNANKEGLLPFSSGRRACLGESLAKMELFIFTSSMIQNYSFHPPEGVAPKELSTESDPLRFLFNISKPYEILIKERH